MLYRKSLVTLISYHCTTCREGAYTDVISKGNWTKAKAFLYENKILFVGVILPTVMLLRFPALMVVAYRGLYYCGNIALLVLLRSGHDTYIRISTHLHANART